MLTSEGTIQNLLESRLRTRIDELRRQLRQTLPEKERQRLLWVLMGYQEKLQEMRDNDL